MPSELGAGAAEGNSATTTVRRVSNESIDDMQVWWIILVWTVVSEVILLFYMRDNGLLVCIQLMCPSEVRQTVLQSLFSVSSGCMLQLRNPGSGSTSKKKNLNCSYRYRYASKQALNTGNFVPPRLVKYCKGIKT